MNNIGTFFFIILQIGQPPNPYKLLWQDKST